MYHSIESINSMIINRVEDRFQQLLDIVSNELAYLFMFAPRYAVTHELDPPWDYSGMLIKLDQKFSHGDYSVVADFLEEYTGQSRASHVSRCGFFHVSYEEHFNSILMDFVFECYCEVLSEIDSEILVELLIKSGYEVSEEDKSDLVLITRDYELFEEPLGYHNELLERLGMINFEWMILRGREQALKRYAAKMQLMKESTDRMREDRRKAEVLWNKLQKMYKLETGNQLQKIEIKDYVMFRQFLDFNQVTREERILLVQQLSHQFSAKVRLNLSQ